MSKGAEKFVSAPTPSTRTSKCTFNALMARVRSRVSGLRHPKINPVLARSDNVITLRAFPRNPLEIATSGTLFVKLQSAFNTGIYRVQSAVIGETSSERVPRMQK